MPVSSRLTKGVESSRPGISSPAVKFTDLVGSCSKAISLIKELVGLLPLVMGNMTWGSRVLLPTMQSSMLMSHCWFAFQSRQASFHMHIATDL